MGEADEFRRIASQWNVGGEPIRASARLQGRHSRLKRQGPAGPTGMRPLRQVYYRDELELCRLLRRRKREGTDVMAELLGLGSVIVGPGGNRRQYDAAAAFRLAFPRRDTLPHLRSDK
jgi:hypothetical protein